MRVVLSIYSVSGCGRTSRLALSPHIPRRKRGPRRRRGARGAGVPRPQSRCRQCRCRRPRARSDQRMDQRPASLRAAGPPRSFTHVYLTYSQTRQTSHTNTRGTHTGMRQAYTRESDAVPASLLLCCSAHCHSAQGGPEPHGSPWQPMAAAARLAARGAWRVHGACHRAMARGARHAARGTWVGGTCMARSRRVSSSLSSGLGLGLRLGSGLRVRVKVSVRVRG